MTDYDWGMLIGLILLFILGVIRENTLKFIKGVKSWAKVIK